MFQHHEVLMFGLKLNNTRNFHSHEVVGRGNDTQSSSNGESLDKKA